METEGNVTELASSRPDATGGWADLAEVERFAEQIREFQAGRLDPEAFRRIRLWNGIYGQRGLTDVHMLRVKAPMGVLEPDHLEALAEVAETYSRGFGHVTTRQNIQFHFVPLDKLADAMRIVARAGMTGRESCGDVVRNVVGCPLAGVCPQEVVDVSRAGEEIARHFLRNPLSQDLPRKFKIAVSGCGIDCAQGGINDVGVIAVARDAEDGAREIGYRLVVGGGLGADPIGAQELESFVSYDDLLVTIEAVLRTYDRIFDRYCDRTKRTHARMKFLVERMGIDAFREAVRAERAKLASAAGTDRGRRATEEALRAARPPAPQAPAPAPAPRRSEGAMFELWRSRNVVAQKQEGLFAVHVPLPLGDITAQQLRALATFLRDRGGELRTTIRQKLVIRDLPAGSLGMLWRTLSAVGLAAAEHGSAGNVVSCPGSETCQLAFTASRGLAGAIRDAVSAAGLAEVPGVSVNISGCQNSCGQHQIAGIGFTGFARRDPEGNEAPAYRVLVGGSVTEGSARFGEYVAKLAARRGPEAVVRVVRRFADERLDGESFAAWVERATPQSLSADLTDLEPLPAKSEEPGLYEDWGGEGPFRVEMGRGECAS